MYIYELMLNGLCTDTRIRFQVESFKDFLLSTKTHINVYNADEPRKLLHCFHMPSEVDEFLKDHPEAYNVAGTITAKMPKIILVGHARHGKDTVADRLGRKYGFKWLSSSDFATSRIMMPFFNDMGPAYAYKTAAACHADRVHHRKMWYEQIKEWNSGDLTRMTREIFASGHDMSVGMRWHRELWACKNAGIADAVIWVDASEREFPESTDSCTIEPWMADFIIDNNGSLADMEKSADAVMRRLQVPVKTPK